MLRKKIKASAIQNLTDARYFAAWEVEWLSFNLEEGSETYIAPGNMKAMREWVDGVQIVGEFPTRNSLEVVEWAKLLDLTWLQVGVNAALEVLQDYQIIQEHIITPLTDFEELRMRLATCQGQVQYFQLDFERDGLSWENLDENARIKRTHLQQICQEFPVILSIGFKPENLEALSDYLAYQALNLQGGDEEKVGFKSYDDLDEILEQLEVEI